MTKTRFKITLVVVAEDDGTLTPELIEAAAREHFSDEFESVSLEREEVSE